MIINYNRFSINVQDVDYDYLKNILFTGFVSIDKKVEELEGIFRNKFGVKYAIACTNATQGLIISLKSSGWRNKRIAVPAFTWPSTIYAIESNNGNIPVFCDINPKTWAINLSYLKETDYDAVLAVDIFGSSTKVDTNKPLIYDAAHGYNLDNLGHRGLVEVISLSFTKTLTAMEGGMILTNDENIYEVAKELRRLSSRMPEFNAMIALQSLKNYDKNFARRLELKNKYIKQLKFKYTLQEVSSDCNCSVFCILLENSFIRDRITNELKNNNIGYKTYYEPIVHGLPVTDDIYSRIIALPLYPTLTDDEHNYICDIMNKSIEKFSPGIGYLLNSGYLDKYLRKEV